jgi:DNA-binding MarR family transcriptional regulator
MQKSSTTIRIYNLLKDLFFTIEDGDRLFFQERGLTVTRFYAMWHLSVQPGQTLRDLSDRMLCDKSNVSRIVKGLEREGLIYREQHESDGRAYRLFLTGTGRATVNLVNVEHQAYNEERFAGNLSADSYADLEMTLKRLKVALTEKLTPNG